MSRRLKVLLVEDVPEHAELILRELKRAGFEPDFVRVDTEVEYRKHLSEELEIVISDFELPQFSGMAALQMLKAARLDVPFILVSGTMGEDMAVAAMKEGATDYLLKDRLTRLGKAIEHAVEERRLRREKRQAEELNSRLAAIIESSDDAIIGLELTGLVTSWNPAAERIFGFPAELACGRMLQTLIVADGLLHLTTDLVPKLAAGQSAVHLETVRWRKDHPPLDLAVTVSPIRGPDRALVGASLVARDITGHKQAEATLQESEARFRQLAENINEVFWMVDPRTGVLLYVSPAYEKVWGRKLETCYASPGEWLAAVHPEDLERVREANATKLIRGGYDEEYRIIRPDGQVRWIRDCAFPIRDATGQVYRMVGVAEDFTKRRQLEEQFRQSQKMDAIGQLAGGVAHDFNNMLSLIQGSVGLLELGGPLTPEQQESAGEINQAVERAASLTRQLLMFSRQQTLQLCDLDLNEVVTGITKMLRRILGEDIQMHCHYATVALPLRADAGMLDQILLNLVVNSRDAMPKGGRLIIETRAVELNEGAAAQMPPARPGAFVCLQVTDTGCGIGPEILPQIFDPFFTTKEIGKGTGLGLATVFGIVQQHQGWIAVDSKVGEGTVFQIYFPRLAHRSPTPSDQLPLAAARRGVETILLAEDDPAVRAMFRQMLTRLGYRVLEATSGRSALEVWTQNQQAVNLLLTDLVMPDGLSGLELAQLLRKHNPQLKVIYTSGYSADIAGKDMELREGLNFLAKPCQAAKLAQTVRNCLDQP